MGTISSMRRDEMILGADNPRKGQGIINFRDDELCWHCKVWPLRRIGGLYG